MTEQKTDRWYRQLCSCASISVLWRSNFCWGC